MDSLLPMDSEYADALSSSPRGSLVPVDNHYLDTLLMEGDSLPQPDSVSELCRGSKSISGGASLSAASTTDVSSGSGRCSSLTNTADMLDLETGTNSVMSIQRSSPMPKQAAKAAETRKDLVADAGARRAVGCALKGRVPKELVEAYHVEYTWLTVKRKLESNSRLTELRIVLRRDPAAVDALLRRTLDTSRDKELVQCIQHRDQEMKALLLDPWPQPAANADCVAEMIGSAHACHDLLVEQHLIALGDLLSSSLPKINDMLTSLKRRADFQADERSKVARGGD